MNGESKRPRTVVSLKLILLIAVMAGLGSLLIRQYMDDADKARQRAKKFAEIAAKYAPPAPEFDPEKLSEAPLEMPDYLDGAVFDSRLTLTSAGEKAHQVAVSAKADIVDLKKMRPAAAPTPTALVPITSYTKTQREQRDRYYSYRLLELAAYRQHSADTGAAKASGEVFLEAFLKYVCERNDSLGLYEVVSLGHDAIEAGCNDPLIRTYLAECDYRATDDASTADAVWSETLLELRNTPYPRNVSFFARNFAYLAAAESYSDEARHRIEPLVVATVRWLEEEGARPEWSDCVLETLLPVWNFQRTSFNRSVLIGCFQSPDIDPWIVHCLAGQHNIVLAWNERGAAYADDVKAQEWDGFRSHLTIAADHLEYAWSLRANHPFPASQMISVAMAGGDTRYKPQDWFRRAVECRFDYYSAYFGLQNALLPRWGGSHQELMEFFRNCLHTDRFDTFVPYALVDLLPQLRQVEFEGKLEPLLRLHVDKLLLEFLERRNRYRDTHPGEALHGDSPYFRSRLGMLLEEYGMFDAAVAEFQSGNGYLNPAVMHERNRMGYHIYRRVHAAQGENRDQVLAFDDQLRKRWPADTPPEAIDPLREQLQELRTTATDEESEKYYKHAERMLDQLQSYFAGDWVELSFADGALGWDFQANYYTIGTNTDELELSRNRGSIPHVWARPIAHFSPPFTVEVDVEPVGHHPFHLFGVQWCKPLVWSEQYWTAQEPNVGIQINAFLNKQIGQTYTETALFSHPTWRSFYFVWLRRGKPGGRHLRFTLWESVYESAIGKAWRITSLPEPITSEGILSFGEPYPLRSSLDLARSRGTARLSGVRIRRMTIGSPPAEDAPLETADAYWTDRVEQDKNDLIAAAMLADTRLRQDRPDDVLQITAEILARQPEMTRVGGMRGRAFLMLKRYAEAWQAIDLTDAEPGDELDAMTVSAEILAMAPVDSLRDGQKAMARARMASNHPGRHQPRAIAALAAAHAELGDFESAVTELQRAIDAADEEFKSELQDRLQLYESGRPYRLPPASDDSP